MSDGSAGSGGSRRDPAVLPEAGAERHDSVPIPPSAAPRKERGILFSAPMVRALLLGRKTQTRRIIRDDWWRCLDPDDEDDRARALVMCPYGVPGDRLWVRETHAQFAVGNRTRDAPQCVAYRATCDADGGFDYVNNGDEIMRLKVTKWTPAIHMPRWASRITLDVVGTRIECLQDITEADAQAEGVERDTEPCDHTRQSCEDVGCMGPTYRSTFCELWDAINGEQAPWSSNPWVWVVEFRRLDA